MGIETTVPPLARSTFGFEDRDRHLFGTHFHREPCTARWTGSKRGERSASGRDGSVRIRGEERGDVGGIAGGNFDHPGAAIWIAID